MNTFVGLLPRRAVAQPDCPKCKGTARSPMVHDGICSCVGFYVLNAVCWGWFCPNTPMCGVFVSDEKSILLECRTCKTPRPLAGLAGRPL